MGCKNSLVKPISESDSAEGSFDCGIPSSKKGGVLRSIRKSFSESLSVEWKVIIPNTEARKLYEEDGTIEKGCPDSYVELRVMLDEHVSRTALGKYAIQSKMAAPLMCWLDIQEFKEIFAENYRYAKGLDIYHTYVKADCTFQLDFLASQDIQKVKGDLDYIEHDLYLMTPGFYDGLQRRCLNFIHNSIYINFRETEDFLVLSRRLDKKYNRVKVNDFIYYNALGEGGFGYVVHCKKKSTGIHYAMKVQRKLDLIKSAGHNPSHVYLEKKAFSVCQHPFIINLAYAFQTEKLAFMVLELSLAGDIQQLLGKCPSNKLDEEHARFFMAEVALGVAYLHQTGYIYRDLKPSNILLEEDGHVKLLDLGGCADLNDTATHAVKRRIQLQAPVSPSIADPVADNAPANAGQGYKDGLASFYQRLGETRSTRPKVQDPEKPTSVSITDEELHRFDVFGTLIYMAPEMLVMLTQRERDKEGYTKSVDWWSFGVTLYKMLTGSRPFIDDDFTKFVSMSTKMHNKLVKYESNTNYYKLFQEIYFPPDVSEVAQDFIRKLLNVDGRQRLGAGANGSKDVQEHPFFKDIDWVLLELKRVKPPDRVSINKYLPSPEAERAEIEALPGVTFEEFFEEKKPAAWLEDEVPEMFQQYFKEWEYVSGSCMRMESGLARVRNQYENNSKVRQLIGEKDSKLASVRLAKSVTSAKNTVLSSPTK